MVHGGGVGLRVIYMTIGVICILLGAIGIVLPLLPTTPFLLVAAWAFSRSSPRFEAWLINHPTFGPPLRAWREEGAIPRGAKVLALAVMSASFVVLAVSGRLPVVALIAVGVFLAVCAAFILTRPVPAVRRRDE